MECRNKWSRATENFCPCFEASKPLLDTAVTREAKTLLQTWTDAKFASDCLMGFRVAFTCCFVKTFLMERAPFISTRGRRAESFRKDSKGFRLSKRVTQFIELNEFATKT
jgi:hypothetical protein